MQNEITTPGDLLTPNGNLAQAGYSKRPVLNYNPERIARFPFQFANRLRLKEWDYYAVTTRDHFFSVCVSNIGYIGLVFAYFIDFKTNRLIDDIIITPLGKGCALPRTSQTGHVHFQSDPVKISFLKKPLNRHLKVDWPNFAKQTHLTADLMLSQPESLDSIVMATPITDTCFYYNHKINCMPVTGQFSMDYTRYDLMPDKALAGLDWGRGVWPYKSFWIWASASGFSENGDTMGLNLGKGFGDLSHATENCFYINGKMFKLGNVSIDYTPKNTMNTWRFESEDKRLNLLFTPFFHRRSNFNLLVLKTKVNQMFGRYDGELIDDDGQTHEIKNLIGWAENHHALW